MSSSTLKIHVEGNDFFLSCRERERFFIGSAPDCKLSLDAVGIEEEHCAVERISENTFLIRQINRASVTVNGVAAKEIEANAPLLLTLGRYKLELSLVDDPDEELGEAERDLPATAPPPEEEALSAAAVSPPPAPSPTPSKSILPQAPARKEGAAITNRLETPCARHRKITTVQRARVPRPSAIPAIRFGRSGFSDIGFGETATSRSPSPPPPPPPKQQAHGIPLPKTGESPPPTFAPPRAASAAWLWIPFVTLILFAGSGYGWFWWKDFTLPKSPERLEQLAKNGDLNAAATLALSEWRGEWNAAFAPARGLRRLKRSAGEGNALGIAGLAHLKDNGFIIEGEDRSTGELYRAALDAGLTETSRQIRDPRWHAITARALSERADHDDETVQWFLRKSLRGKSPEGAILKSEWSNDEAETEKWLEKALDFAVLEDRSSSVFAASLRARLLANHPIFHTAERSTKDMFERAAILGSAEGKHRLGLILELEDATEEAFAEFEQSAASGYLPAMATLSRCLLDGIGTEISHSQALTLAKKSADDGSREGRLVLARIHGDGLGVPANRELAIDLLSPLAADADTDTQALLGRLLAMNGEWSKAEPLLRDAAEQGQSSAMVELAKRLSTITEEGSNEEAIHWLELANEAGEPEAISLLIAIIDKEGAKARDPWRAVELLEELSKRGDLRSTFLLSDYYFRGRGIAQNPEKAFLLIKRAAEGGVTEAWYPLANLYKTGAGKIGASEALALKAYEEAYAANDKRLEEVFPGIFSANAVAGEFLKSLENDDYSATTELLHSSVTQYLALTDPSATAVAALESGFRQLWSSRNFQLQQNAKVTITSLDHYEVELPYTFDLADRVRKVSGKGVLTLSFTKENGASKPISVKERIEIDNFSPNEEYFQTSDCLRTLLPALPLELATYRLAILPRGQRDFVNASPFTDKFGVRHSLIPTATENELIRFSYTNREGDVYLPIAYFDIVVQQQIARMIDAQFFDLFEREFNSITTAPDRSDPYTSKLFQRAEGGDHEAEAIVGAHYYDGLATFPVDRVEALKWFVRSARARHPLGRVWIAIMCQNDGINSSDSPLAQFRAVLPDIVPYIAEANVRPVYWRATAECYAGAEQMDFGSRQPRELLQRGVEAGDLRAMLLKGIYELERSPIDGLRLLRYAADGGCATAALKLAEYYLGPGNDSNLVEDLLLVSARKNSTEGQLALGTFVAESGQEPERAAFWMEMALRNAIKTADRSLEVRIRESVRQWKNSIGEDSFRQAANFLNKN